MDIKQKGLKESLSDFENACDEHISRHGRNARVYISGPMSGIPREEFLRRFLEAEATLRKKGFYRIVNPINVWTCRWPWLYKIIGYKLTLWYDLQLLKRCDAIYLLDGWHKSKGAVCEYNVAWHHQLEIYKENDKFYSIREL